MSRPVSGIRPGLSTDQRTRIELLVEEAALLASYEAEELVVDRLEEDAAAAEQRCRWYRSWLLLPPEQRPIDHPLITAAIADHASTAIDAGLLAYIQRRCPSPVEYAAS